MSILLNCSRFPNSAKFQFSEISSKMLASIFRLFATCAVKVFFAPTLVKNNRNFTKTLMIIVSKMCFKIGVQTYIIRQKERVLLFILASTGFFNSSPVDQSIDAQLGQRAHEPRARLRERERDAPRGKVHPFLRSFLCASDDIPESDRG